MNLQSHLVLIILIQITNHHDDLIMMTSGIIKPCNSELQISRLPTRCSGRPCLTDLRGRCWTSTPGKFTQSLLPSVLGALIGKGPAVLHSWGEVTTFLPTTISFLPSVQKVLPPDFVPASVSLRCKCNKQTKTNKQKNVHHLLIPEL
jgi:hypothetical protein